MTNKTKKILFISTISLIFVSECVLMYYYSNKNKSTENIIVDKKDIQENLINRDYGNDIIENKVNKVNKVNKKGKKVQKNNLNLE